jgi:hypothetical protein
MAQTSPSRCWSNVVAPVTAVARRHSDVSYLQPRRGWRDTRLTTTPHADESWPQRFADISHGGEVFVRCSFAAAAKRPRLATFVRYVCGAARRTRKKIDQRTQTFTAPPNGRAMLIRHSSPTTTDDRRDKFRDCRRRMFGPR